MPEERRNSWETPLSSIRLASSSVKQAPPVTQPGRGSESLSDCVQAQEQSLFHGETMANRYFVGTIELRTWWCYFWVRDWSMKFLIRTRNGTNHEAMQILTRTAESLRSGSRGWKVLGWSYVHLDAFGPEVEDLAGGAPPSFPRLLGWKDS